MTYNKIIYVDDDRDDRDFFKFILSELDCEATFCESADDFFARVNDVLQNSIVFVDLNMPGTSGQEIITKLRTQYSPQELPIIAVSGSYFESVILTAYNNGANGFLVKISSMEIMKNMVEQILQTDYSAEKVKLDDFLAL